jgi:hypothetical protein
MSINFTCDSCGHDLEAETSMAGEAVDCPSCSTTVIVPTPKPLPRDLLKKSVEDASDGQKKLLRALLDESALQTKLLNSIHRMITWFYLTAIFAFLFALVDTILHSFK